MFHGWQYLTAEDREAILRGVVDGRVYGGPYHLELDWVDLCNARCFFCNSEATHNGERIPWERAQTLIEEAGAGGLRSVRLSGGGEPTLHPQLADLLDLLAARGIVLDNLNTNGLNLPPRVIEALGRARVGEVRVSLNFSDEESYTRGMGLPARSFGRVVDNIRRLSAMRRAPSAGGGLGAGDPDAGGLGELQVQFFVYRPTVGQIRRAYDLGRELGADRIIFRELWEIDPSLSFQPEDLPEIARQMREVLREDRREGRVISQLESHGAGELIRRIRAEVHGADVAPPLAQDPSAMPEAAPPDFSDRYCYIGWYSMTIMGNQAVYPCCFMLSEKSRGPLGSLKDKTIREVWRGREYTRFRRELRDTFLLQRPVPFFARRTRHIAPQCATHTGCPVTTGMCDEAFYAEADRRLAAIRRRPLTRLWRFANHRLADGGLWLANLKR